MFNTKKRRQVVSIALLGALTLSGCTASGQVLSRTEANYEGEALAPVETTVGNIHLSVDPRIELLTAIQILVPEYGDLMTHLDFSYKQDVLDHFSPYQKEAVVTRQKQLMGKGFAYDAPPAACIHMENPPSLKQSLAFRPELLTRVGGQGTMDRFFDEAAAFSDKSEFLQFYQSQRPFYEDIVSKVASQLKDSDPSKDLDDFFAMPRDGYHLILSPLSIGGGYGPSVVNQSGGLEIYGIIGPTDVTKGLPSFSEKSIHDLVWHEFSHSYVNSLTSANEKEVKTLEPLFEPIQKQMSQMAYGQWSYALNEHIIRAINVYFIDKYSGEAAAKEALNNEYSSGFRYIKPLYEAIQTYASNREQYKSFDTYYPELLKVLEPFNNEASLNEIKQYEFEGPINNAFLTGMQTLLVTGDPEKQPHYKPVVAYVQKIRDKFFNESEIITFEALKDKSIADYNVVCFGLPQDVIEAFSQTKLPFDVKDKALVLAGEQYTSEEKPQFITCWKNPENAQNALIIYTALSPELLVDINHLFHGAKDFHLFKAGEEVKGGFYEKDGGAWTIRQ